MLKEQHRGLQATLAKRSEANTDRNAIVNEFAAAWLPHVAVEQDVLVPASKNAGIDEHKLAAVAIHKDLINWLLADLLSDESREFSQAKLEALANQFDAHVEGADAEDHGLFAIVSSAETANPGLNAQIERAIRPPQKPLRQIGRKHRRGNRYAGAEAPLRTLKEPAKS